MSLQWATDAAMYAEQCCALTAAAASASAQLVCFPEHTALPLLALLDPDFAGSWATGLLQADKLPAFSAHWRRVFPAAQRVYRATFARLARKSGVSIVAGALLVPAPGGGLVSMAHLFLPDGRVAIRQAKLAQAVFGDDLADAVSVDTVVVSEAAGARSALLCGEDAAHFEIARCAVAAGAEILAAPAAGVTAESPWEARQQLWTLAQSCMVFGVRACLVAGAVGLPWRGRSGIYAPLELTEDGTGVLVEAESADQEEVIVASVDLAQLRQLRQSEAPELPVALVQRYLSGSGAASRLIARDA